MRSAALLLGLATVLCAAELKIDTSKLVDLTYTLEENAVFWPTAESFRWKKDAWGVSPGGYWYASASFASSEHGGTHLDSPIHFAERGVTTDQIPVSSLIAPAVVVDVSAVCSKNRDYALQVTDLAAAERAYGRIPEGSILLVHTGWGKYWPDRKRYLGDDKPGDASNLHFPGLSREAAEWIVARKLSGVGIDTASLDPGPSRDFMAHRVLNGAGIYGLENVANLGKITMRGATVVALPMKIKGGTGGPVRIVAFIP